MNVTRKLILLQSSDILWLKLGFQKSYVTKQNISNQILCGSVDLYAVYWKWRQV